MDNQPLSSPSQSELDELKAQYKSLHSLVISLLLLTIVISGTFWVFLRRQVKNTKTDLAIMRVGYTNALATYEQTRPVIDETVKKLQEFGRTNADFAPILAKYKLLPEPASTLTKGVRVPAKK